MEPILKHMFRFSFIFLALGTAAGVLRGVAALGLPLTAFATIETPEVLFLHGFVLMATMALLYHVLPKFVGAFLWSKNLVTAHFALAVVGVPLWAAAPLLPHFVKTAPELAGRVQGFGMVLASLGLLIGAVNLLMSLNYKGKMSI